MHNVNCIVVVTLNVNVTVCARMTTHNIGAGVVYSSVGDRTPRQNNVRAGTHGCDGQWPRRSVINPLKSYMWSRHRYPNAMLSPKN